MIGIDWLEAYSAVWEFASGSLFIGEKRYALKHRHTKSTWIRRVTVAENIVIPARSECDVPVNVMCRNVGSEPISAGKLWITKQRVVKPEMMVSSTLLTDAVSDVCVRVVNLADADLGLNKDEYVSDLEPAELVNDNAREEDAVEDGATPAHIKAIVDSVDPSISYESRRKLEALLNKYADTFSTGDTDLGKTAVVVHSIDIGDHPPIRQPLRRVPQAQRATIDHHIDEQLKQGIIRPSCSPFAQNLVVVKKSDGSTRCCVDYRQVNAVTRKDAYPLPRTDQCLSALD
jgi:hypothetical protein